MFDSIKNKFKLTSGDNEEKDEKGKKKKIENLVFLIILLIVTVIIINSVWSGGTENSKSNNDKVLAEVLDNDNTNNANGYYALQENLENILETMQGVGKVKVLINYAETSTTVAMYNESKTESTTEEKDTEGGTRNVTQTDTQKEIAYTSESGDSAPITEKIVMPTIEGAIVTAQGASNATVKANIISAIQAVTGLAAHKIQVFTMKIN